jgi:hypothetical protein
MRRFIPMALLAGSAVFAATHSVTISGLGGEPDYETRFTGLAAEVHKLMAAAPGTESHLFTGALSQKAKIRETLQKIAQSAKPEDTVIITLIGHGTFDGSDYKINLPGPDLSAAELAALLAKIPAQKQLIVNTTSASGGAIAALQSPKRVIVSATKSPTEKNATVFARYWVEALRNPAADTDKNEAVTALEAFRYADQKTVQYYETQKRLATEHAVLEDTGKGEGVRAPSPENGQGLNAGRLTLLQLGAAQKAAADPAKQKLLARRDDIEKRIDQLKYNKAAIPSADYRKQLNALLVELARVQAEIDQ